MSLCVFLCVCGVCNSIFEHLIAAKWEAFGRAFHWHYTMIPHAIVLGMYMLLVMVRVTLVYERRSGERFPGKSFLRSYLRHCHANTYFRIWRQRVAGDLRIRGELLELNEFQLWFAPTTIGISLFILIVHALTERRFEYTDLDPNEDQSITFQARIFLFVWVHHELQENCWSVMQPVDWMTVLR